MRDIDSGIKGKLQKNELTKAERSQVDFKVYIGRSKEFIQSDSDYFVELIRKKAGVSDIEVVPRRMKPLRNPDKLFDIHIDNGIITTATRNYVKRDGEEWQDQFQLGRGLVCSICFDGRWVSKRGKWMLLTEEFPWVFYTDSSKKLYAQIWNKTTERIELATGVVKVKSIRGWKSVNFKDLDLGVIALYLKTDGKLYYRNYCEQADGKILWENEQEFSYEGTVANFNLFETNDYRLGVAITNTENKTKIYFSKRNWAGMGIRGEFLNVQVSEKIEFLGLDYWNGYDRENINLDVQESILYGYCKTDNRLLQVYNQDDGNGDWGKEVVFGTWHDLYHLQGSDFKITDSRGVSAAAYEVEYLGRGDWEHRYPYLYRAKFQNINNFRGECTAEILGNTTQNAIGQTYEAMLLKFTPTGLVPIEIPAPQLLTATNTDDQHIVLTFNRQIYGGATESVSAFIITSTAYKTTNTQEIVEDTHDVTACALSEDKLQVTLTIDVKTRIKRAINITVKYQNGAMVGEAEPVANFETTFEATIVDYVNDMLDREHLNMSVIEIIEFMKINYKSGYERENINMSVVETVEFIDVGNVNP